jgi:hypothetical protein
LGIGSFSSSHISETVKAKNKAIGILQTGFFKAEFNGTKTT